MNNIDVQNVKHSTAAIIGMFLGVCSLLASVALSGFYFGIPGFIVSMVALQDIKKNKLRGNGMALIGITTSVVGFVISTIFTILMISIVMANTYVG